MHRVSRKFVQVFDGNPKTFRDWIKQIEKYCKFTNLHEAKKKLVVFQASCFQGAVS